MRRSAAILILLWCVAWSGAALYGAANNPKSQSAVYVQGPDPTGNAGYPIAVVGAPNATPLPIMAQPDKVVTFAFNMASSPLDIDVQGYSSISISVDNASSFSSGVIGFDGSADGTNFAPGVPFWDLNNGSIRFKAQPTWFVGPNTAVGRVGGLKTFRLDPAVGGAMDLVTGTVRVSMAVGIDPHQYLYSLPFDSYLNPTSGRVTDGQDVTGAIPQHVLSLPGLRTGAAGLVDIERTPHIFKTVSVTASGNTALWTPTSGKKFRLMSYSIEATGDAAQASAGDIIVDLKDGASTSTGRTHTLFVPGTALAAGMIYNSTQQQIGNGYVSTTANNVLNVNLSAALTSGAIRVNCAGTEESLLRDWLAMTLACWLWIIRERRRRRSNYAERSIASNRLG